jgi:hypothetical protein
VRVKVVARMTADAQWTSKTWPTGGVHYETPTHLPTSAPLVHPALDNAPEVPRSVPVERAPTHNVDRLHSSHNGSNAQWGQSHRGTEEMLGELPVDGETVRSYTES